MNIFYLDSDPTKCAQQHVDKHCVKMILEYAQLLSTAHRVIDGNPMEGRSQSGRRKTVYCLPDSRDTIVYSATHINHPSAIWARAGVKQYTWLHSLLVELCKEYTHRYNKYHKVERDGLLWELAKTPNKINHDLPWSEPTPAMPDHYKVAGDSIQSYRNYYLGDKQRMFSWKNRETPSWINQGNKVPTYEFRNKVTGETHEKFMSYSSRQQYLSDNPDLETVLGAPTLVYEPGTNLKVSDGFREVISKIKDTHRVNNIKSY